MKLLFSPTNLVKMLVSSFMFYADDPSGGGGGSTKPEPQTFSLEYVRELREENKSHRLLNQELAAKLKTAEEAIANSAKELEAKVAEAVNAGKQQLLHAKLAIEAKVAGLIDLDALKLVDTSKVTLKDDGTVEGAEALFKGLKETKPYLFDEKKSTTTTTTPPAADPPAAKKASEMTDAEYAAARAAIVAGK